MNNSDKPIGYWLRRADQLLTTRIDEAQRANGLDRLDWQVLQVLGEGHASRARITEALHPFANFFTIDTVLKDFVRRGMIDGSDATGFTLTPSGEALRERALALQSSIRERAVVGIRPEDYTTALAVLQRLVENLESEGR
jgi:DNA-binding MarR family transcriptional regulator